jgi:hypothetical protein
MRYKNIKRNFAALFFSAMIIASGCGKQEITVNAGDYGLTQEEDAVPALRKALEACVEQGATKLIIPKGKYNCFPAKATEKYLRVSNNDNGMKRILFPLEGIKDFEIDGQGSQFIMNGQMVAIDVDNCEDITLNNFSIDWKKPFYFQGEVVAVNKETNSFDLKVYEECDYEIVAHELLFLEKAKKAIRTWERWSIPLEEDYGWEQNIDWNIWYDSKTKAPAFDHGKSILRSYNEELKVRYRAEEIEPDLIRIFDATNYLPKKGWVLVVKGRKDKTRLSPAIHLFHNKNVRLENVDVHHSGGMGLIGERCENVTLVDFNVVLPANSDRMVTTSADATHFVNCKGLLSYDNCHFENMLDDAGNFHGIYTKVEGLVDDYTIGVRRMHGQQLGFQFAEAGDSIRLSDSKPMQPYAALKVVEVNDLNEEYMTLRFDKKVNEILRPSSVADNISWQANVDFRNSTVRRNRARTILISTQGDVLIENNNFSTCTAFSLLFEGDATYWHESGPVNNVVIRNNTFKDFGLVNGNCQILRFTPRVAFDGAPTNYYHNNVIFENNTCEVSSRVLVYANSVKNLLIRGNTILPSKDYPLSASNANVFEFTKSKDIRIEDNDYKWDREATVAKDKYSNVIMKGNKGISME